MNCMSLYKKGTNRNRFESKIPARHTPGWTPTISYKSHELDTFTSETGEYKDSAVVSEVEVTK
jgi:hypothetical protein